MLLAGATGALSQRTDSQTTPPEANQTGRIPIRKVTLPGGGRFFALPVRVGSEELFAGIDSGSSGLRVLTRALRDGDYRSLGQPSSYSYMSGTSLHGVRADANLAFGPVQGHATIQVIQSLSCLPSNPGCAEGHLPMQQVGLMGGGKPGQGAPAIIGIHNNANIPVTVPFPALGVKQWIVDIPNDLGGGGMVFNPPAGELAGFVHFGYGSDPKAGPTDAIRGCLQNEKTHRRICGVIEFDTGAPGMSVSSPEALPKSWPPNTPASLLYQDERGRTLLVQSFRTGDPSHSSRLRFDRSPKDRFTVIHANCSPYFCFDVLYQADGGGIGLRPRRSGRNDPQAREVEPGKDDRR